MQKLMKTPKRVEILFCSTHRGKLGLIFALTVMTIRLTAVKSMFNLFCWFVCILHYLMTLSVTIQINSIA